MKRLTVRSSIRHPHNPQKWESPLIGCSNTFATQECYSLWFCGSRFMLVCMEYRKLIHAASWCSVLTNQSRPKITSPEKCSVKQVLFTRMSGFIFSTLFRIRNTQSLNLNQEGGNTHRGFSWILLVPLALPNAPWPRLSKSSSINLLYSSCRSTLECQTEHKPEHLSLSND